MQHRPRKRFGQNFLVDDTVITKIVETIQPNPTQTIVEIGPGLGAITKPLLEKSGVLTAIELDRDLASRLRDRFGDKISLYNTDALEFDFASLEAESRLRVVGNLPYNISTPLLFHLLEYAKIIKDMHFMLQKEVVDRMVAAPNNKSYGRLSVMIGMYCETEALFDIEPGSFNPPPKVVSSFVRLTPKSEQPDPILASHVQRIVTAAFSMRRKTIRNSLKKLLSSEQLLSAEIDPNLRAENVSLSGYLRLADTLMAQND